MQQEIAARSAELTEMRDAKSAARSWAAFALESAMTQPIVRSSPIAEPICRRAQKLLEQGQKDSLVQAVASQWPTRSDDCDSNRPDFRIPPKPVKVGVGYGLDDLTVWGPAIADCVFPRGTWPWAVSREAALFAADGFQTGDLSGKASMVEFKRTFKDPRTGPVGRWALIQAAKMRGIPDVYIAKTARYALQSWKPTEITKDVALLTRGDHGLPKLTRAAVQILEDLPEEDRRLLLDQLPEPWSGIVQRLVDRRAAHSEEAPEAAVETVLLEAWESGYSNVLMADLRALAGEEQPLLETAERPAP